MYNYLDDTMDYSVNSETIQSYTSYPNRNTVLLTGTKGFHLVKRKIGKRKKTEIGYFTTSYVPESKIVNAITGLRYRDEDPKCKYAVGSIQEDLLFKVRISNGETGQEPVLLFYDSPEQCEKHQHFTLNQNMKETWLNKKMKCLHNMRLQNNR